MSQNNVNNNKEFLDQKLKWKPWWVMKDQWDIWATFLRALSAHLPDTRQMSRATPAGSSAWYSPAEPRDTCRLICWYSPAEPRHTCRVICLILASRAARHLPAHLPDTRQRSRATSARSSAWYSATEPRDTCPLICLKLASGATRHLPAHLPDTRQRSRATPACSSAWYSRADPRDTCRLISLILASWAARHLPAHTICSDFGAQEKKFCHCFHCFPSHEVMRLDAMIFVFWMLSFKLTLKTGSGLDWNTGLTPTQSKLFLRRIRTI